MTLAFARAAQGNSKFFIDVVDQMAIDVGRLRRSTPEGSSQAYRASLLAKDIHALWWAMHPTAADLYRAYLLVAGYEEVALSEALMVVDAQDRALVDILGGRW